MPASLTQWISLFRRKSARPAASTADPASQLRHARSALLHCVHDCAESGIKRLQHKIQGARTHRELWSLRTEVYHCVAMHHHQALATERVQSLAPHFEGWVEPSEMGQTPR